MDAAQVADVEGVLVSAGLVGLALLLAATAHPRLRREIVVPLAGSGTALAAGIALLATLGSLWFSEEAGFPPCELCWYQRIAMYPLVVVLGIAGFRDGASARLAGLVLALAGLAVSIWHNIIETFPDIESGSCDPAAPCTVRWVEGLGFWTIPRMAAACFVLIIGLTAIDHFVRRRPEETSP